MFHQELCLYHATNHKANEEDKNFYLDHKVLRNLGSYQAKIHRSNNSNTSKWVDGISCAHKCIIVGSRSNVGNPIRKYDQPIVHASRLLNKAKPDYTTTKKEALVMVYALYKFKHFLSIFYLQCT
jgi:hypothetical protein